MMKKKYFLLIIFALIFNYVYPVNINCLDSSFDIIIANNIEDNDCPFPINKPRMPPVSNGPISATYNTTTELLQLIFRLDLGEGTISIRQNEEEIISEQMNFSEALQVSYSLSGCPSGEYEITVSTTDGTFIGYLQKE